MLEAMQDIATAFMLAFMGAIPLVAFASVLVWRRRDRPALSWIFASCVLFLAVFCVINVPLAKAGNVQRLVAACEQFGSRWASWSIVPALLRTTAFGCPA
ncbi:hypothetical protein ACQEU3_38225 [Spirillospora sp. CA-253888]